MRVGSYGKHRRVETPKLINRLSALLCVAHLVVSSTTEAADLTAAESPVTTKELPASSEWLTYSRPPECPGEEAVNSRLEEWIGGDGLTDAQLVVHAKVKWEEEYWTIDVRMNHGEVVGQRSVSVRTCAEAADFIAIVVALAVNPELSSELPELAEPPLPEEKEPEPEPSPQAESQDTAASSAAKKTDKTEEAPPQELEDEESLEAPSIFASLSGGVQWGRLPEPAPALEVQLGLRWRWLHASVSLTGHPTQTVSPLVAENSLEFAYLGSLARVCAFRQSPILDLGLCALGGGGRLQVIELSPSRRRTFGWLLEAGLGADLTWRALPWLHPFLAAEALIPLIAPNLIVTGGARVHSPQTGLQGRAGVRVFFDAL